MGEQQQYELVCKDRFDRHDKKLDEIIHCLKGNGEIGMCEKQRRLDARIEVIESEHKMVKQTLRKYFGWAAGIVGGWWLLSKSPLMFEWLKKVL